MSLEQENFEQLRRLFVLKRYEQPPPGFFDRFSRDVIERIRAGEQSLEVSWFERLGWEAPWLQRLWSVFDTKPILAGALGVAVCGLLVSGIVYSDQVEPAQTGLATLGAEPQVAQIASQQTAPLLQQTPTSGLSSPGVVLPSEDSSSSLFREIQRARHAQPVNFIRTGGN